MLLFFPYDQILALLPFYPLMYELYQFFIYIFQILDESQKFLLYNKWLNQLLIPLISNHQIHYFFQWQLLKHLYSLSHKVNDTFSTLYQYFIKKYLIRVQEHQFRGQEIYTLRVQRLVFHIFFVFLLQNI